MQWKWRLIDAKVGKEENNLKTDEIAIMMSKGRPIRDNNETNARTGKVNIKWFGAVSDTGNGQTMLCDGQKVNGLSEQTKTVRESLLGQFLVAC